MRHCSSLVIHWTLQNTLILGESLKTNLSYGSECTACSFIRATCLYSLLKSSQSLFSCLNSAAEYFRNPKFYELIPLSPSDTFLSKFLEGILFLNCNHQLDFSLLLIFMPQRQRNITSDPIFIHLPIKQDIFLCNIGKTRWTAQQAVTQLSFIIKHRGGMHAPKHSMSEVCLTFPWLLLNRDKGTEDLPGN